MLVRDVGEFGLIDRLRSIIEKEDPSVLVGIGDDGAVVHYERPVVMTTDALVEGIHFREDWIDYQSTGYKSLVASISDVAAMGARPRHALVTLAVPKDGTIEPILEIYRGMKEACDAYSLSVVGGDVVSTDGPLMLSIALTGELIGDRPLKRCGAKVGDQVFITGDIGGAGAYVHMMSHDKMGVLAPQDAVLLSDRHRRPTAQVEAAEILATQVICTSANDISDGLGSELHEIATASGVHLAIMEDRLPIPPGVRHYARLAGVHARDFALFGGEDYQLVGTVARNSAGPFLALMQARGIRVTLIGRVEDGDPGVDLLTQSGREIIHKKGFDHFGGQS